MCHIREVRCRNKSRVPRACSTRGPSDLLRNVPNTGRDITNLCHHEPVVMVRGRFSGSL